MEKRVKSGHATGMAGEFLVMERLFRLGLEPALTLGNAKQVDIMVRAPRQLYEISVKTVCGGGKWSVGRWNYAGHANLLFVFLLYKKFDDPETTVEAWVIPASDVERLKRPWLGGSQAVFYSNPEDRRLLEPFKEAWAIYFK